MLTFGVEITWISDMRNFEDTNLHFEKNITAFGVEKSLSWKSILFLPFGGF